MGVFDAAQSVVASASGLIIGDTSINISSVMVGIEDRLMEMELGPLFGLWFQSLFVGIISMCSIQTAVGTIRSTTRKAKSCWMAVLLTAAPLKIRRLHLLPGLSERRYLPFRA